MDSTDSALQTLNVLTHQRDRQFCVSYCPTYFFSHSATTDVQFLPSFFFSLQKMFRYELKERHIIVIYEAHFDKLHC